MLSAKLPSDDCIDSGLSPRPTRARGYRYMMQDATRIAASGNESPRAPPNASLMPHPRAARPPPPFSFGHSRNFQLLRAFLKLNFIKCEKVIDHSYVKFCALQFSFGTFFDISYCSRLMSETPFFGKLPFFTIVFIRSLLSNIKNAAISRRKS